LGDGGEEKILPPFLKRKTERGLNRALHGDQGKERSHDTSLMSKNRKKKTGLWFSLSREGRRKAGAQDQKPKKAAQGGACPKGPIWEGGALKKRL